MRPSGSCGAGLWCEGASSPDNEGQKPTLLHYFIASRLLCFRLLKKGKKKKTPTPHHHHPTAHSGYQRSSPRLLISSEPPQTAC